MNKERFWGAEVAGVESLLRQALGFFKSDHRGYNPQGSTLPRGRIKKVIGFALCRGCSDPGTRIFLVTQKFALSPPLVIDARGTSQGCLGSVPVIDNICLLKFVALPISIGFQVSNVEWSDCVEVGR